MIQAKNKDQLLKMIKPGITMDEDLIKLIYAFDLENIGFHDMAIEKLISAGIPDANGKYNIWVENYENGRDESYRKAAEADKKTCRAKNGEPISFKRLVPFDHHSYKRLPDYPVDALPDEIRPYVLAVAESLQVPVDMVANTVLGAVSTCIQGKFEIEVKTGWIETLNLYIVTVLCPSERKSPTLKEVMRPLYTYIVKYNGKIADDIREYESTKNVLKGKVKHIQESLSKQKKNAKDGYTKEDLFEAKKELDELKEVKPLQMIVDDITPEALVEVMKNNGEKLSIISAEGGVFGLLAGRYSNNVNLDLYLKAYSGEYYSAARISREFVEMSNPLLTISLAVQPQIIRDIMGNVEFRGRGLLARFLYSIPNSRVGERFYNSEPIPEKIRDQYDQLIYFLLEIPATVGTIHLSAEAEKLSEQYNEMIEKRLTEDLEDIEDWAGKLHGNTMRIAGLLHVIKNREDAADVLLDAETLQSAIDIGLYYLDHAKAAFDIMGMAEPQDETDAKNILSHCVTRDKCDIRDKTLSYTKREVLRKCRKFHKTEELDAGLDCLVDRGYIAILKEKPDSGGRISERIYFNPEYLETLS